jgi:MFS family permease
MSWSPRARPRRIFGALAVAGFAYAISQTMLIPSLPDIESAFSATPSEATMLMTAFWVSGAVTAGIFGRLGDMFGKRLMIVLQMGLFSLGALVCAVAPSLVVMIGGRVLMGCGVGLFPLAYSLIRDELPPQRVASSIALLAGLVAGGAAVGQSIGGLVSDNLGFRSVFWIALGFGLLSVAALVAFVPESPVRTGGRVDVVGATVFAAGIAAPLVAIAEAPAWGWGAPRTIALLLIGLALLALFVRLEMRTREPLIDIPTLLLPRIRLTNAATLFVGFGFFGFSAILSQFFQEPTSTGYGPGADATQAGLYLVPGLLVLMIASPLAGRLSSRFGPVFTFRLGIVICTSGVAAMTISHSHPFELYLWPAVMYMGTGATFGAMPTIILQTVPPEKSGQSSGINMIIRTTGSAIGVQLAAMLITTSIGSSGAPSDAGYTAAFALATGAGVVALALALAIPRRLEPAVEPGLARLTPAAGTAPPS